MLLDNSSPRYLPHLHHPDVLLMGLNPLGKAPWIETDRDIGRYHRHKLQQRAQRGENVYYGDEDSLAAQRELAAMLTGHLLQDHPDCYRRRGDTLECSAGDFRVDLSAEPPLWTVSLAVADDLVIMEQRSDQYHLTAASLCSPSHWLLMEKAGRPIREIHDPIPGFHRQLSAKIDRFFDHLRPQHPVVRYNWSLQADDALAQLPGAPPTLSDASPLYYRVERQVLLRLPRSGGIAFSIRVYLHPLAMLAQTDGALPALIAAIEATPPQLSRYKGFDLVQAALAKYRG